MPVEEFQMVEALLKMDLMVKIVFLTDELLLEAEVEPEMGL